jgi:hypothetical protein
VVINKVRYGLLELVFWDSAVALATCSATCLPRLVGPIISLTTYAHILSDVHGKSNTSGFRTSASHGLACINRAHVFSSSPLTFDGLNKVVIVGARIDMRHETHQPGVIAGARTTL